MKPFKFLVFITLFWGSLASAQDATDATGPQLAVFPFVSSEPRLGFAVADRLTLRVSKPEHPAGTRARARAAPVIARSYLYQPLKPLGE